MVWLPAAKLPPYITGGPLTAVFGDLVSTNRGLRPLSLEGFSEDLNEDGFVDPIGQPVVYSADGVASPVIQPPAGSADGVANPVIRPPAGSSVYNTIPQVSSQLMV